MTEHKYHLSRLSANKKLGGLPASTQSTSTCPHRCSLKLNGCYAEFSNLATHWRAVSEGTRGVSLDEFCKQVKLLPRGQLWRFGQAGDLPGDGVTVDRGDLNKLVSANRGRSGFGFTHYDPALNADAIRHANANGFTVNLSAETLAEADEFAALGVGPVVVLLPQDAKDNFKTEAGNTVVVCPASLTEATCAICGACSVATRKSIIGFPAHGPGKTKAQKVFFAVKA